MSRTKVFLSSRFAEFDPLRKALWGLMAASDDLEAVILDAGRAAALPVGDFSLAELDDCDLMVLLLGTTYAEGREVSFTELEFDFAKDSEIPVLVYSPGLEPTDDRARAFLTAVQETHTIGRIAGVGLEPDDALRVVADVRAEVARHLDGEADVEPGGVVSLDPKAIFDELQSLGAKNLVHWVPGAAMAAASPNGSSAAEKRRAGLLVLSENDGARAVDRLMASYRDNEDDWCSAYVLSRLLEQSYSRGLADAADVRVRASTDAWSAARRTLPADRDFSPLDSRGGAPLPSDRIRSRRAAASGLLLTRALVDRDQPNDLLRALEVLDALRADFGSAYSHDGAGAPQDSRVASALRLEIRARSQQHGADPAWSEVRNAVQARVNVEDTVSSMLGMAPDHALLEIGKLPDPMRTEARLMARDLLRRWFPEQTRGSGDASADDLLRVIRASYRARLRELRRRWRSEFGSDPRATWVEMTAEDAVRTATAWSGGRSGANSLGRPSYPTVAFREYAPQWRASTGALTRDVEARTYATVCSPLHGGRSGSLCALGLLAGAADHALHEDIALVAADPGVVDDTPLRRPEPAPVPAPAPAPSPAPAPAPAPVVVPPREGTIENGHRLTQRPDGSWTWVALPAAAAPQAVQRASATPSATRSSSGTLAAVARGLTTTGRGGRAEFIWSFVLLLVLAFALEAVRGQQGSSATFATVAMVLLLAPLALVTARRLHDVGLPGWLFIVVFLSIYIPGGLGLLLWIALMAVPGRTGDNRYGPPTGTSRSAGRRRFRW